MVWQNSLMCNISVDKNNVEDKQDPLTSTHQTIQKENIVRWDNSARS